MQISSDLYIKVLIELQQAEKVIEEISEYAHTLVKTEKKISEKIFKILEG